VRPFHWWRFGGDYEFQSLLFWISGSEQYNVFGHLAQIPHVFQSLLFWISGSEKKRLCAELTPGVEVSIPVVLDQR